MRQMEFKINSNADDHTGYLANSTWLESLYPGIWQE